MNRGSLIIYDILDGTIYFNSGDGVGVQPHKKPSLPHLITEYGELNGKIPLKVDISTNPHTLVLEEAPLTEFEQMKKELDEVKQQNADLAFMLMESQGGGE